MTELRIAERDYSVDYERAEFGQRWADVDRTGCDQRNDVLDRDLVDVVYRPGTQDCIVIRGTFHDPYSGETVAFERGPATSQAVHIDHVVALADAWWMGAAAWTLEERELFANDTVNLLASDGGLNQSKGASNADEWLPPNESFRCAYVARQVAVKSTYDLAVTQAEYGTMIGVLDGCPDEPLPR